MQEGTVRGRGIWAGLGDTPAQTLSVDKRQQGPRLGGPRAHVSEEGRAPGRLCQDVPRAWEEGEGGTEEASSALRERCRSGWGWPAAPRGRTDELGAPLRSVWRWRLSWLEGWRLLLQAQRRACSGRPAARCSRSTWPTDEAGLRVRRRTRGCA